MPEVIHIGSAAPADCGADCPEFIRSWLAWAPRIQPEAAMITVPIDESDYLAAIGPKTRNMIRKAERAGYTYREFEYNDELDALWAINRSTPERQGKPMSKSYRERPDPSHGVQDLCDEHRRVWVGGYVGETLSAYCQLVLCGELAIVNRILGHADFLRDGVMDGLALALVRRCIGTRVRFINYLTLKTSPGLRHFKESTGFRPLAVEVIA